MSKVVQLNTRMPRQSPQQKQAALMRCFAQHRRFGDDVFWLKENAELLNILEVTGAKPGQEALAAQGGFYRNVEKRLGFFPQYYRFLLSICLDLEDLGIGGTKGEALVNWVADQGLAESELSDLQRGEARRLMLRRGRDPLPNDTGLEDRLRGFSERSVAFAMPNKKAAYELVHTVFYLSEYGRKDPQLGQATLLSLQNAGTLAYLDQNVDLLAEVCVALRYGGFEPVPMWESWLLRATQGFAVEKGEAAPAQDDYHEYLVSNWLLAVAGHEAFAQHYEAGRMGFVRATGRIGPLREMSENMFRLDEQRSDDWGKMRGLVSDGMGDEALAILAEAEQAVDGFDRFFAGFARVGLQQPVSA